MRARHVLLPALLAVVAALLLLLLLSPGAPESEGSAGGAGADDGSGPPDATLVGTKDAATPSPAAPLVEAPPLEEPAPGGPGRCSLYGMVTRGRSPCAATIEVRRVSDAFARGSLVERTLAWSGRLLADPKAGEVVARVEAGEDGAYEIRGLPVGSYEVQAKQAEGAGSQRTVTLSPEGERVRRDLTLPDGRFTLRGRLLESGGAPWVGYVILQPGGAGFATDWRVIRALDAEGRFTIPNLPRGPLSAQALRAGTLRVTRDRALDVPHDGEWTWIVDQGFGSVEARVVDAATGTPLEGASWFVFSYRTSSMLQASGHADAEGRCQIPLGPAADRAGILASAAGYAAAWTSTPWEDPLVIRLGRAARVEGRVTDATTGVPVPGARVCLAGSGEWSQGSAITDEKGHYVLDGLPSGRCLLYALGSGWVSVEIDDGVRAAAEALTVHLEGGRTTRRDLRVRKTPRILGRLLDAGGVPVHGARVKASVHHQQSPLVEAQLLQLDAAGFGEFQSPLSGQMADETTSGEDGVYVLNGLTPGLAYTVRATAPEKPPVESDRVVVGATGVVRLDLAFPPPRWLEVKVVDAWSGEPLPGASIWLSGEGVWKESATDANGRGRLGPLGEEASSLSVEAEGHQGRRWISVEDGTSEVEIRLEPGLVMSGRVLLPDGAPVAEGPVILTLLGNPDDAPDQSIYAPTDEAGRFESRSLWPGRYRVEAQDRWQDPTATGSVEAEAGDTNVVLRLVKR